MNFSYKVADFEGPMDLLLHLINRHKLNIHDIPIFELVEQYIEAVRSMQIDGNMDEASEFVDMASRLIYIKTVALLPVHEEAEELKRELEGELIEYRDCKYIASKLAERTDGFNFFVKQAEKIEVSKEYTRIHPPEDIAAAYLSAVGKGKRKLPPPATAFTPIVSHKIVPVHVRISFVMKSLLKRTKMGLKKLYHTSHDKSELIATFLAVLQLARDKKVYIDGEGEEAQIKIIRGESGNG